MTRMNNRSIRYLFTALLLLCSSVIVYGQEKSLFGTHALYDDVYNPQRSHFGNSGSYLGLSILPVLAGTSVNLDLKGPFWQLIKTNAFKNDSINNQYLIDNYGEFNYLQTEIDIQLLMLKIRTSKKYKGEFSFAVSNNIFINTQLKTELLALPFVGNASFVDKRQDGFFDGSIYGTTNARVSAGYRMNITKKLGIGAQVSGYKSAFLYNAELQDSYFQMGKVEDGAPIEAYLKGKLLVAGPLSGVTLGATGGLPTDSLTKLLISSATKYVNIGYGISLGADFDVNPRLNVTAGVKNLGWTKYDEGATIYTLDKTLNFEGLSQDTAKNDSIIKAFTTLTNYAIDTQHIKKFYRYLPSSVVVGGSYKLTSWLIARGFIDYTLFPTRPVNDEKLNFYRDFKSYNSDRLINYTAIANLKFGPLNYIFNYSTDNKGNNTAGAQFLYRSTHYDFFVGLEQIGFIGDVAKDVVVKDEYARYIPRTNSTAGANFNFGIAMRLGSNRKPKAKPTAIPLAVIDEEPLVYDTMLVDTDGDEVLDHVDECPEVKGAIDNNGCPNPDTDGDGVVDKFDLCPDVVGLKERGGCPVPDTDGDGIPDELDKCPNDKGLPENDGCPLVKAAPLVAADRDNDGVVDTLDKCIDEFGLLANQGCPEEKKIAILTKQEAAVISTVFQNLVFKTGKAIIASVSFSSLDNLATLLNGNDKFTILIEGHTDNVGKKKANKKLSEDRANSVAEYLKAKGVARERIKTVGYGDTKPLYKNNTADNKAKNRRVEFTVLTK